MAGGGFSGNQKTPLDTPLGGGGLLVGKGVQEVWEKKRKKGKIMLIINKKLTGKINNYEEKRKK